MDSKIPCVRCLLEAAGRMDTVKLIKDNIEKLKIEDKADEELYKKRLDICLSCEDLNAGTCMRCGCYVELRAAGKNAYCPAANKKW